jgi:hypothetical protein
VGGGWAGSWRFLFLYSLALSLMSAYGTALFLCLYG